MFAFVSLFAGMLEASYGGLDSTQFFVERPAANVTAREGEDVLLKCRVGNLQGKAQWTRNGFAMGECAQGGAMRGGNRFCLLRR